MGREYKKKIYEIIFTSGKILTIFCSQIELKTIIKENKIRGYKCLKNF